MTSDVDEKLLDAQAERPDGGCPPPAAVLSSETACVPTVFAQCEHGNWGACWVCEAEARYRVEDENVKLRRLVRNLRSTLKDRERKLKLSQNNKADQRHE